MDDFSNIIDKRQSQLTNNLDLDIDLSERLRQRVDLDKTRIDGASETTELGDKTNITLLDRLVRVGAADAARNGSESTDSRAERVDHAAIPAGVGGIFGIRLDDLRIRWLQIFATRRLDVDDRLARSSGGCAGVRVGCPLDSVAVGVAVSLEGAHCGGCDVVVC